ncbi:hypothetical protein D3C84_1112780 [compost metagenome]
MIAGAEGMAGILYDAKTILLPKAVYLFQIAGQACEVYRDDHLGQASLRLGDNQFAFQL